MLSLFAYLIFSANALSRTKRNVHEMNFFHSNLILWVLQLIGLIWNQPILKLQISFFQNWLLWLEINGDIYWHFLSILTLKHNLVIQDWKFDQMNRLVFKNSNSIWFGFIRQQLYIEIPSSHKAWLGWEPSLYYFSMFVDFFWPTQPLYQH